MANYPWDGTSDKKTRYAESPDDAAFRRLARAYADAHPTMRDSAEIRRRRHERREVVPLTRRRAGLALRADGHDGTHHRDERRQVARRGAPPSALARAQTRRVRRRRGASDEPFRDGRRGTRRRRTSRAGREPRHPGRGLPFAANELGYFARPVGGPEAKGSARVTLEASAPGYASTKIVVDVDAENGAVAKVVLERARTDAEAYVDTDVDGVPRVPRVPSFGAGGRRLRGDGGATARGSSRGAAGGCVRGGGVRAVGLGGGGEVQESDEGAQARCGARGGGVMGGGTESGGRTNVILKYGPPKFATPDTVTRHTRIVVGRERQTADSGRVPRNREREGFFAECFRSDVRIGRGVRSADAAWAHRQASAHGRRPDRAPRACFRTRRAGGAGGNRARASSIRSAGARRARRDANSEERVPLRATPWCWAVLHSVAGWKADKYQVRVATLDRARGHTPDACRALRRRDVPLPPRR